MQPPYAPSNSAHQLQQALRPQLKHKRAATSKLHKQLSSQQHARALSKARVFKRAKHIAVYQASAEECCTNTLITLILKCKKHCYLPSCEADRTLSFQRYTQGSKLKAGPYNIQQLRFGKKFNARKMDVVIAPLLGFDQRGSRLGMGGGYYDRTFNFKKRHKHPFLIGLAFNTQQLCYIPPNPWDRKLQAVLVNGQLRYFKP